MNYLHQILKLAIIAFAIAPMTGSSAQTTLKRINVKKSEKLNRLSNHNCEQIARERYREFSVNRFNNFNADRTSVRAFDAGPMPQILNNTSHDDNRSQKVYSPNQLREKKPKIPGRDLLGDNFDLDGNVVGLELSSFPRECQSDENDQLILFLRAIELNKQIYELSAVSISELTIDQKEKFEMLRREQDRLFEKAAKPRVENSNPSLCASNGPPTSYYCAAGLPEAHLYLVFGFGLLADESRIKCDLATIRHWEVVRKSNIIDFRKKLLQSLNGLRCQELESMVVGK